MVIVCAIIAQGMGMDLAASMYGHQMATYMAEFLPLPVSARSAPALYPLLRRNLAPFRRKCLAPFHSIMREKESQ